MSVFFSLIDRQSRRLGGVETCKAFANCLLFKVRASRRRGYVRILEPVTRKSRANEYFFFSLHWLTGSLSQTGRRRLQQKR
jgi:hypothetical protein